MEIRNFVRAWLAFTVLQLVGNLWQCTQPKLFSSILLHKAVVADPTTVAFLFFMHYWTMLLLRLFVIYCFDCIPLQVFHIVCTITSVGFLMFGAFYARMLGRSTVLYAQIALSGGTVLLMLCMWKYLFGVVGKLEKKQRRKQTAVQMMEHEYWHIKKQE